MTDGYDDEVSYDPASAVDWFELYTLDFFEVSNSDPKTTYTIPRDLCRMILELAKKGQHRGRGQRPLSEVEKMKQELTIDWAKERKADLQADNPNADLQADNPNMSAVQAAWQAAGEAKKLLLDDYGMNLKASTIKRRME